MWAWRGIPARTGGPPAHLTARSGTCWRDSDGCPKRGEAPRRNIFDSGALRRRAVVVDGSTGAGRQAWLVSIPPAPSALRAGRRRPPRRALPRPRPSGVGSMSAQAPGVREGHATHFKAANPGACIRPRGASVERSALSPRCCGEQDHGYRTGDRTLRRAGPTDGSDARSAGKVAEVAAEDRCAVRAGRPKVPQLHAK